MTAARLDHVSVTVADMDRSLAFYHDLLGIPILGRGEEGGPEVAEILGIRGARFLYTDLDLGSGQILELLQYLSPVGAPHAPNPYDAGSGHLAIRVEHLDDVLDRLRRAGHPPRSEPVDLKEPEWWAGARCVYLTDPDGVTVELVERARRPTGTRGPHRIG